MSVIEEIAAERRRQIEAERDAARAKVARLREALVEGEPTKAPNWMDGGEANCWADGWNAAVIHINAALAGEGR